MEGPSPKRRQVKSFLPRFKKRKRCHSRRNGKGRHRGVSSDDDKSANTEFFPQTDRPRDVRAWRETCCCSCSVRLEHISTKSCHPANQPAFKAPFPPVLPSKTSWGSTSAVVVPRHLMRVVNPHFRKGRPPRCGVPRLRVAERKPARSGAKTGLEFLSPPYQDGAHEGVDVRSSEAWVKNRCGIQSGFWP